ETQLGKTEDLIDQLLRKNLACINCCDCLLLQVIKNGLALSEQIKAGKQKSQRHSFCSHLCSSCTHGLNTARRNLGDCTLLERGAIRSVRHFLRDAMAVGS